MVLKDCCWFCSESLINLMDERIRELYLTKVGGRPNHSWIKQSAVNLVLLLLSVEAVNSSIFLHVFEILVCTLIL